MRRIAIWFLAAVVLAALWGSGCAGILSEKTNADGNTERVRLGTGSKWSEWTRSPLKEDDSCLILKKESTF